MRAEEDRLNKAEKEAERLKKIEEAKRKDEKEMQATERRLPYLLANFPIFPTMAGRSHAGSEGLPSEKNISDRAHPALALDVSSNSAASIAGR